MSEVGPNPVLSDHEARELCVLIEQRSGIVFDESRQRFLVSRVVDHMQCRRLNYGVELLRLVRASNVEYDQLLERLLTQETRFMRYPGLFTAFEREVLPELRMRKNAGKQNSLRIWSAGCASGEEAYSIAISLCEAAMGPESWETNIWATDISREALTRAELGVYGRRVVENLAPYQLGGYFTQEGENFTVKPRLRTMVKFAPMNLAQPVYLGRFDCIFCMNVLIYFGHELCSRLIQRFFDCLEPGGYLFLGHAESVANVPVNFIQKIMHGTRLLQKPYEDLANDVRAVGAES